MVGLLKEFIEWAKECAEDAFHIFENKDAAIVRFLAEKLYRNQTT